MSCWGPKLYSDDIAEDVRSFYKDQLKRGKLNEEVTTELIERNQDYIMDPDDAPVFWFSLADTQWDMGRLLPYVKEKAIEYLNSGADLERWKTASKKDYEVRKKVLEDLQAKINSPIPPEKRVSQYTFYKCNWQIGDVFAYRLESEFAKVNGLYGRYLLIRKIDMCQWWPGHIIPVTYLYISKHQVLPTIDELDNQEYVQISKYNKLPLFRVKFLSTSKRVIPLKRLTFIGNIKDVKPPDNELILEDNLSVTSCNWSEIEEFALERYLKFNK